MGLRHSHCARGASDRMDHPQADSVWRQEVCQAAQQRRRTSDARTASDDKVQPRDTAACGAGSVAFRI